MVSQPYPFVTRAEHVLVVPGGAEPATIGGLGTGGPHVDILSAGGSAREGRSLPEGLLSFHR